VFPVHPPHIAWKREQKQIEAKSPKNMSMRGIITLQYTYKANVKPGQNQQNSARLFMAGKEGGKGRPLFSCVDNSYQAKRDGWTRHR
jgi:hypothetical protein